MKTNIQHFLERNDGIRYSLVILHLDPDIIGKKLKMGTDDDKTILKYFLKIPQYPTSASDAILKNGGRPILTLI